MDFKKWKSGRHVKPGRWPEDVELYHSMKAGQRFKCKYCREWDRTCPSCAGVY